MANNVLSFDKQGAMQRVDNDVDLLKELVEIFFSEYGPSLENLKKSLAAGAAEDFKRAAHSVKGAAGNVGAMIVHSLAFQMEKAGSSNQLAAAPALLEQFQQAVEQFKVDFEAQIKS